jgi:fatty acid desaturase
VYHVLESGELGMQIQVKPDSGSSLDSSEAMSAERFSSLKRVTLVAKSGIGYRQLRESLTPRWGIVWRDLTLGWIALALIIFTTTALSHRSLVIAFPTAAIGAVLTGFTIAYLMLFMHEAAHSNIHPDPWWNDLLCNIFVSGIVAMDVQSYRQVHWSHHAHFGGPMDTEISYRDPLNLRFLIESLLGVRALKVVLLRKKLQRGDAAKQAKSRSKTGFFVLLGGIVFNALCLAVLLHMHAWAAIFSWICGVLVFFPFFGALRQLLEHRGELPGPAGTRADVICFATNRIFGDGILASTLGAAGFNRHLLHHWDPRVSYTNLRELENFLLETYAGVWLREQRTTYWRTFRNLYAHIDG